MKKYKVIISGIFELDFDVNVESSKIKDILNYLNKDSVVNYDIEDILQEYSYEYLRGNSYIESIKEDMNELKNERIIFLTNFNDDDITIEVEEIKDENTTD
jgi:uncharacterized membrane protein